MMDDGDVAVFPKVIRKKIKCTYKQEHVKHDSLDCSYRSGIVEFVESSLTYILYCVEGTQ